MFKETDCHLDGADSNPPGGGIFVSLKYPKLHSLYFKLPRLSFKSNSSDVSRFIFDRQLTEVKLCAIKNTTTAERSVSRLHFGYFFVTD